MKDSTTKHIAKLLEIFKHKHQFYFVHPKIGNNL
jgi:hypothetical protein